MISIQQFTQNITGGLAVYGVNGGGIATDIYLRKLGLNQSVACFLSHTANPPAAFCGKPVLPLNYIKERPDLSIITAEPDFNALYAKIKGMGCLNPLYYHASFWPWLDKEPPDADFDRIISFYDPQDAHSARLLKALINLRHNANLSRVQPYNAVKDLLYTEDTYWLGRRTLADEFLTVIDAGAFDGDTMQSLFKAYGARIKRYYAFEPMPHIFTKLEQTANKFTNTAPIYCRNAALYNQNAQLGFYKGVPRSSRVSAKGDIFVPGLRLDDLKLEITGKACLKMDIEGAEMAALEGATEFIRTYRPHLALCLYHKSNDVYKIPRFIQSIAPGYKFYLAGGVHTLCYGYCQ